MCGRTSCALRAERYECAASYYNPSCDHYVKPSLDKSSHLELNPSTNVAPTDVTPVLVWDAKSESPTLKPMVWGMIPSWADSNYKSGKYSTHNCRIENVKESSLYKGPLKQGKRCVVICEGYYEWQTVGTSTTKNKNPSFIYVKQPDGMRVDEASCWYNGTWSPEKGWSGPSLTCMAGLYSLWESPEKEIIPSYSVITMSSSSALSWLHHRMPAILSTPEEIKNWLNYEDIDEKEALANLTQCDTLNWHTVSSAVNNSRNKDPDCNKQINDRKKGNQSTLTSWLTKSAKRSMDKKDDEDSNKKTKF